MLIFLFYFFKFSINFSISYIFNKNESFPDPIQYLKDPPPKTKFGFISAYTNDDEEDHYFILALTCGYSLYRTSPNYDRILMIPNEFKISSFKLEKLSKIWTHIIRRPIIELPNSHLDKTIHDSSLWFKLNAWSCVGWSKLLWTGIDVVFRRDPSSIFDFPAPTSVIDHFVYSFSHLGPVTNGNFLLIKPSLLDFAGLKLLALKWCNNPNDNSIRQQQQGVSLTSPYDQGLITQYYDGNISLAPQWYQLEVPGNPKSILGYNNTEESDPRIISFHYPSLFKPWKRDIGPFTYLITNIAYETIEFLNLSIDLTKKGFPTKHEISPNLQVSKELPRAAEASVPYVNEEIDVRLLFPQSQYQKRMNARLYSFLAFTTLILLAIILKTYYDTDPTNYIKSR